MERSGPGDRIVTLDTGAVAAESLCRSAVVLSGRTAAILSSRAFTTATGTGDGSVTVGGSERTDVAQPVDTRAANNRKMVFPIEIPLEQI